MNNSKIIELWNLLRVQAKLEVHLSSLDNSCCDVIIAVQRFVLTMWKHGKGAGEQT